MIKNTIKKIMCKVARPICKEIIDDEAFKSAIMISAALTNKDTFGPYKNLCKGETDVVVCAAGPTLQKYIPIKNAIHIAVNRSFLFNKVDFDFIFAQDMDGIRMVQDELISYRRGKCIKLLSKTTHVMPKTIPESLALKCNAKRFYTDSDIYGNGYKSKMVLDLENRPLGGMPNVGMSVIQFALYMNPRKLYIVGCDMSGNHFATGNQTAEETRKQGQELDKHWAEEHDRLIAKWKEIKNFAEVYYPDTEIISVNPVGLRGLFTDLDQY